MAETEATEGHSRVEWIALSIVLAAMTAVQFDAYLNHDVAWFGWAALQMLHGAQLGRDIFEPNFPMAYLIYLPATLLNLGWGLSGAIKLWLITITGLGLALSNDRLPEASRLPFIVSMGLFLVGAMPREWGQREYVALVMVLPYCIPSSHRGWRAGLVGVLAGVGFCIKPHFLLAWLLVELGQKPLRTEQRALIATGLTYMATILIFYRPFLWTMLPLTSAVYDSFNRPLNPAPFVIAASLLSVVAGLSIKFRNKVALRLALGSVGFGFAALAQERFYTYQMLPCWGLLCAAGAALWPMHLQLKRVLAAIFLLTLGIQFIPASVGWFRDSERRAKALPALTRYLDKYDSFAVWSVHPYPAFPTALHTRARYVGISNSEWFLPAVGQSHGKNVTAARMAVRQAEVELSKRPEIVIVSRDWRRHTLTPPDWNGLTFLKSDPGFAGEWAAYRHIGVIIGYDIYRLRDIP